MEGMIAPMFSALIFDCDGTLVDSMPAHFAAWQAALGPLGITLTEERFYRLAGTPTDRIAAILAREHGVDADPAEVSKTKEANYLASLHLLRPIEPVVQIVRDHWGRTPMAVASGGFRRVVARQLEHVGIAEAFAALVAAEDTSRHKPEPDCFLEAARRLGVPPSECCVYEDADLGVEAARRAGMACVDIRLHPFGILPARSS